MPKTQPLQDRPSLGTQKCSSWSWAAYRAKKPGVTVQAPPASWEPSGPLQSPSPHPWAPAVVPGSWHRQVG